MGGITPVIRAISPSSRSSSLSAVAVWRFLVTSSPGARAARSAQARVPSSYSLAVQNTCSPSPTRSRQSDTTAAAASGRPAHSSSDARAAACVPNVIEPSERRICCSARSSARAAASNSPSWARRYPSDRYAIPACTPVGERSMTSSSSCSASRQRPTCSKRSATSPRRKSPHWRSTPELACGRDSFPRHRDRFLDAARRVRERRCRWCSCGVSRRRGGGGVRSRAPVSPPEQLGRPRRPR